ncbi:MAG: hypothetical protein WAO19_08320, partial [Candidatus Kryptoniota bacterium]
MKQNFYLTICAAMVIVFMMPGRSAAQSDTLVIYATPESISLDSVINHDQAQATPHAVYELASTDTPYTFINGVVINHSVTITGVLGAGGRPPCIQPDPTGTEGQNQHDHLFTFTKSGSQVDIENLYLLGIALDNSINEGDGFGITVTGDSIRLHLNNVVFEQWSQFGIDYSGNWDKLLIYNCKFRNFVNPGSDYTGEPIRFRNDLGKMSQDTVVVKYCTFLAVNAYVACVGITSYIRYIDFEHNSVVGVYKNPFFSMNATNWTVAHNIFYAAYAGGMANGEYPWWDRIWAPGIGAVIDLDTLSKTIAGTFGIDTSVSDWITTAELARNIQVNDNVYFMPAAITNFITAWDDTAHGLDSIYTCGWMNPYTDSMFANHPNFYDVGNKIGVDPGYGPGIAAMINELLRYMK